MSYRGGHCLRRGQPKSGGFPPFPGNAAGAHYPGRYPGLYARLMISSVTFVPRPAAALDTDQVVSTS